MGRRTSGVRTVDQPLQEGEFDCPTSEDQGERLSCQDCLARRGSDGGGQASPSIRPHGPRIAGGWRDRRYGHRMALLSAREEMGVGRLSLPALN